MSLIVESGSIRTLRSSYRGAHGPQANELQQLVAGSAYRNTPFQYLPDSEAAMRLTFMYHWKSGAQIAADMGTTDGTTSDIFFVNTNSATYTATSSQAGYEGQGVLTTGGTTGNHAGFIGCPSFLPVANQLAVCYTSFYMPDPNVNAFDLFFGFANKTIAPGTSSTYPTDGAYWKGVTGSGVIPMKGITSSNAANTDNDAQATRTVSAAQQTLGGGAGGTGTAQSVELAVVMHGQSSADFWIRLPATATNTWKLVNQTTTLARGTIQMRPHFLPVTRYSGTIAIQVMEMAYWWIRPATR